MRIQANFCELCASNGIIKLAKGYYTTDLGRHWDACGSHLEQVKKHQWEIEMYNTLGNVNPNYFVQ